MELKNIKSLIYLSRGNLPSQMAHTAQIAKMSQALSQKVDNFELITSGNLGAAIRGLDQEFKDWYNLHRDFKLVRLPVHLRKCFPFPKTYQSSRYFKLALLYTYLKSPSLVYCRTVPLVERLLKMGIPVLWEWHEPIKDGSSESNFFKYKNLVGVVTLSQKLAEQYIQIGLDAEKVLVAHSAVELENFLPHQDQKIARNNLHLPLNQKIIVYSGHLYEGKGIKTIIETAHLLPEYQFILVGGWTGDIERVKKLCQDENLLNVRLIGHVPQSQLSSYLYAADILILPTSQYWNLATFTSPLKLFEYMAVKKPIVASALPNIMTVLRNRENALLAEPDDALSFQQAINELIEKPDLADNIAESAYQEVKNFTWEKRAERVLNFAKARMK